MQTLPSVLIYSATFRRISLVTPGSMPAAARPPAPKQVDPAPLPALAWRCAADCISAVTQDLHAFSMRAISSGHTNWNSKYFEQLRCAYVVASPVAAFAARR